MFGELELNWSWRIQSSLDPGPSIPASDLIGPFTINKVNKR